ncbi:exonuclease RecJ [Halobaculum sp. D14]|uniref:exonuclease RecJ n=1 Tax=Halobaculum sp. D14 TaxID=3421642 RepID=UPI003EB9ADE5
MSSTQPGRADADPERVASALSTAGFVRLCARPTGDALAAAGLLARALRDRGTPFHVRTTRDGSVPAGDGTAVALGWDAPDAQSVRGEDRPLSVVAASVVDALGAEPDPVVGLAGVVAAEAVPGGAGSGALLEEAERRGAVRRRPGVAVPTADVADGLASSTLLRLPCSGDPEAARALLADLGFPVEPDDDAHRRLASTVALDATAEAPPRATEAVERALRPYATPTGPFETLGGYADVLDAVARERPGVGVSLALGADAARADALECWRTHAGTAHGFLDDPTTGRYDGVFVVRVDVEPTAVPALATAARLARDYRSPEPVALVVARVADGGGDEADGAGDDAVGGAAAAAAAPDADVSAALAAAADATGGDATGDGRRGDARFDGDVQAFVQAFREAVQP